MKYFTPELLLAYGSNDPAVYKDADARWDQACDRHAAFLASVDHLLPAGLRRLEGYNLHDARVHEIGVRDGGFVVVLRLGSPPKHLLTLTYDLVEEAVIQPEALAVELRFSSPIPEWQYDELEMVPGEPPSWRQSVLLSNGWELTLHFRDVRVEEFRPLLPVFANGAASPAPQSA